MFSTDCRDPIYHHQRQNKQTQPKRAVRIVQIQTLQAAHVYKFASSKISWINEWTAHSNGAYHRSIVWLTKPVSPPAAMYIRRFHAVEC